MRRALALALLVAAGCSDFDQAGSLVEPQLSAGPKDGFKKVMVRADGPTRPGEAGAPLVTNLADALERVAVGGTIEVYPGEYSIESVLIDKAVTIQAAGDEKPVLRTVNSLEGFLVRGVATGEVVFKGLAFRNDYAGTTSNGLTVFSYSIRGNTQYASVRIEDSDFAMLTGGHASGVQFAAGAAPGATLTVLRSTFTGGRAALAHTGGFASVEVRDSRFEHFRRTPVTGNFGVQIGNLPSFVFTNNVMRDCDDICLNAFAAQMTLTENTMSECARFRCIAVTAGTSLIANNTLSNIPTHLATYSDFNHQVILVTGQNTVTRIENNDIDGCGRGQCITAINGSHGEIVNNRMTVRHGEGTTLGIVLSDGSAGNANNPALGAHFVVTDNVVRGIGGTAATDPAANTSYPFFWAGVLAEGHSSMTAERNTIEGGWVGLQTRTASKLSGSGNVISASRVGIGAYDPGSKATLRGNDVLGSILRAFDAHNPVPGTHDLRCNYWGSASGPLSFNTNQGPGVYQPFATAPVAARAGAACVSGL